MRNKVKCYEVVQSRNHVPEERRDETGLEMQDTWKMITMQ